MFVTNWNRKILDIIRYSVFINIIEDFFKYLSAFLKEWKSTRVFSFDKNFSIIV